MYNEIINYYKKLPKHGLYYNDESKKLKYFKKFINHFKNKTNYLPEVVYLKKKIKLEKDKKTNTLEYANNLQKISQIGINIMNSGKNFEETSYKQLLKYVKNIFKDKIKFTIYKNKTLFNKIDNEWKLVGEIDALIIFQKNNINFILFICEIKYNFDDLPDSFYQINRTFNIIKNKQNDNVRIDNIILDNSYKLYYDNVFETSLIISKFIPDNDIYFNIQSKLKYLILMLINIYETSPSKIISKVNKKQINGRYTKDVLEILQLFKKKKLTNRIIIM